MIYGTPCTLKDSNSSFPSGVLGVPPHRYQAKINLYPYNQKNAILFVEIYRKDGVFDESYHFQ